jgi:hypothetical protein
MDKGLAEVLHTVSADAGGRQLLTPRPRPPTLALQAQFSSIKTALQLLLINEFLIAS